MNIDATLNRILKALACPYRGWHHWRYRRACLNYFYFLGLMSVKTLDDKDIFKVRAHLLLAEQAVEYHAERAGVEA